MRSLVFFNYFMLRVMEKESFVFVLFYSFFLFTLTGGFLFVVLSFWGFVWFV